MAHTQEQKIDKHMGAKTILLSDIESAIAEIDDYHMRFSGGERSTWICELTAMAKRLDIMRLDGVDFDAAVKNSVFTARSTLLQDKEEWTGMPGCQDTPSSSKPDHAKDLFDEVGWIHGLDPLVTPAWGIYQGYHQRTE